MECWFHYGIGKDGMLNKYDENHLPSDADKINLGAHKRQHVKQYDQTGILFMPSYFMNGGISYKNPYEQEADKFGHQGYINQQNR